MPYVGVYSRPFLEVELSIDADGRLDATVTQKKGFPEADSPLAPPWTGGLAPYASDRFVFAEGPREGGKLEIIRRVDGSIGWLRVGGRIHARMPER